MKSSGAAGLLLLAVVTLWLRSLQVVVAADVSGATRVMASEKTSVETKIQEVVADLRIWQQEFESSDRPFVTAAFAQSLDGYMAAYDETTSTTTVNYPLSGDESLLLTHALRSMHSGILVGGRTLSMDNPRLTNRLWGTEIDRLTSPRPILLDSHLNHIQKLGQNCRLENPIVCCTEQAASSLETLPFNAQILACRCNADGMLDIRDVLQQLKRRHGIQSVMVEGGAAVLSSFFEEGLVDALCITIAPKLLLSGAAPTFRGPNSDKSHINLARGSNRFISLGHDTTLVSRMDKDR